VPTAPIKLAYVLSHPIQYQSPLLRRIAAEPGIELTVLYTSDYSVRGFKDVGFGVEVKWDVPLLDGYRYKYLPRLRDADEVYVFAPLNYGFLSEFRRGGYDVIWVHGYATANAMHAMLAARLLGLPVLQRMEGTLIDRPRTGAKLRIKSAVLARLRHLVDAVLPIGSLNADYWREYLPETPQFLMPYAVDNASFAAKTAAAAPNRELLRAELGLEPGRPIILFCSKLTERKRCIDLLEAYALLSIDGQDGQDGHTAPLPYLLIAGDGEQRAALEARTKQLGWSSIRFLGFKNQSELPALYDLCDVFCLPSVHEPWGLIVNELMAAGRAVVVSDEVGCQRDLVQDGVTGFVHRAYDVPALAAALRRLTTEPGLAQKIGAAGQARIASWDYEADLRGLKAALEFVTADSGKAVSTRTASRTPVGAEAVSESKATPGGLR
jgi:glycosyltransferase involved in cell wall biosynthesis